VKNKINRLHPLRHAIAAVALGLATGQAQAVNYTFSDLGTMTGLYSGYGANGVNNLGQVSGYGNDASGVWAAIRWNGDTATALPYGSGGTSGLGIGINNAGQIAGYNSYPVAADRYDAIRWDGGTAVALDNLGFGYFSAGLGINNQGQVVGESWAGTSIHPTLWNGTAVTDLGTLGGSSGEAWSINEAGQIAGSSNTTNDEAKHATLWNSGAIIDLGTLGGTTSNAFSIDNLGQIVGKSLLTGDAISHATLWNVDGSAPVDLGSLGVGSVAEAVNDAGIVVGGSNMADGSEHATLWTGGSMIDLNIYLPADLVAAGWILNQANAISGNGIIVGWAGSTLDPTVRASFKLTPSAVPVPGAVWLFGSALAGLGVIGRRKAGRG
jgi:probable HAF family extracellular repeat protein